MSGIHSHSAERRSADPLELGLYVLSMALLAVVVVAVSPAHLVYDEEVFFPNIALLMRTGLNVEFLRALDQSPGPLYQLFHSAAAGLTNLEIRSMRLLNLACVGLSIALVAGWTAQAGLGSSRRWAVAGSMLALPPMWVISGLALTEAPAMLCLSASVYLLLRSLQHPGEVVQGLMATLAGLLLSFAILGRTPYLMVIPAAWVFAAGSSVTALRRLVPFTAAALLLPVTVFFAWEGLTPPPVSAIQGGLNPLFALYGFAYAGAFVALLAPRWIRWNPRAAAAAAIIAVAGAVANSIGPRLSHLPLATVAARVLPAEVVLLLGQVFPAVMAGVGLYVLFLMLAQLWDARRDPVRLFVTLSALAIIATCAKSTAQFSSRYVVQAAPFLVCMVAEPSVGGMGPRVRFVLGAALGMASLLSYYR